VLKVDYHRANFGGARISLTSRAAKNAEFFTGSIAQRLSASLYLIYSEADFEDFRPAGATRCTDGGDERSPPPCQISPPSVQRLGYRTPKTEFFTEI